MSAAGYQTRRKPSWKTLALIVILHVLALFGLASALAPEFTERIVEEATSLVTVTVSTYEEPEPEMAPSPTSAERDEGAAAEAGKVAVPNETVAPDSPLPRPSAAPRVASTGAADTSGATDRGERTGAGGEGEGPGSGRSGAGRGAGGGIAAGPTVLSGSIDSARDFPVPPGGRQVRSGTSVTVVFTVGVDGRASNCIVRDPGPDPATNALLCQLVIDRIRFNPARDVDGNPVAARYGWRQEFFRR